MSDTVNTSTEQNEPVKDVLTIAEHEAILSKSIEDAKKQLNSEIDRRVSKFVQENKQLKEQLEAERKDKMTAEDLIKYEQQQAKAKADEAERRVKEANIQYNRIRLMAELGLPPEIEKYIVGESSEDMYNSISEFQGYLNKQVKSALEAKTKEILGSQQPPASATGTGGVKYRPGMSQEEIRKHINEPGFLESVGDYQKLQRRQ